MSGKLLLVIPPVVRMIDGAYEVEADFANNLRLYLINFSHVTFACPVSPGGKNTGILRSFPIEKLIDSSRLTYIPLPYTYREDRHLRHYFATKRLLRSEIARADYLLFSPHAMYDWSTLAALEAIKMKRKFDMESDWDHGSVQRLILSAMPFGLRKLRKTLWMYSFLRSVKNCLSHSSLALLQGQDVFDAYKEIAPNPHKVLNVQVSSEDQISRTQLDEKLVHLKAGEPLKISYAGRAIPMKGPFDWLNAIQGAIKKGVGLQATWFGDGSLMPQMRDEAERLGITTSIRFSGTVGREEIMTNLRKTDIFLFCHKTGESPRCLGEALAAGCSLVGYDTAYPRDLVGTRGGGKFADMGDWDALVEIISDLNRDRNDLCRLVEAAAESGKLLDRDAAMQNRIDLIKKHLAA